MSNKLVAATKDNVLATPSVPVVAMYLRLLFFTLPMSPVELNERFLMDTGGWQAMKHARALLEMGRVISFNYTPPILKGLVREGETEYRAGLKIRTRSDIRPGGPNCTSSMFGPSTIGSASANKGQEQY